MCHEPEVSSWTTLAVLLFCLCCSIHLHASQPVLQKIDSGWEFRALNAADHPEVKDWHGAQVPGVVQTDLLAKKLIPDPFYGDNESRLQWIGLTDWEYRTTFQVDAATLRREHVTLSSTGSIPLRKSSSTTNRC